MKGFKEVDEKASANNDKIQQSAKEIAAVGEVESLLRHQASFSTAGRSQACAARPPAIHLENSHSRSRWTI
jgi:hypothetical protein